MAVLADPPPSTGPLRPRDASHLLRLSLDFAVSVENQMICVVIVDHPIPAGLSPDRADLLLRLPSGFPDQAPDMFWLAPAVTASGRTIPNTELTETYLNRAWQRWSRHYQQSWRAGIDDLATLFAIVRRCLADAAGAAP